LNEEKLAGIISNTPLACSRHSDCGEGSKRCQQEKQLGAEVVGESKGTLLLFLSSLLVFSLCPPPLSREIVEKLINGVYKQRRSNSLAFVKLYLRQHVQTIIIFFAMSYTITLKESLSLFVIVSTNAVCRSRLC